METEAKYINMTTMMDNVGMFEMDSVKDYYTWSNKQVEWTIYSRIDGVLGNIS